ncbi:MAG: MFS transporter [Proteobacteria bacterium]|nr:MFS transporter [Pseudomonadota bacterium]
MTEPSIDRDRKLPVITKLAYASGTLEESLVLVILPITTVFYNQVMGLPIFLCGTVFMLSWIIDAISDPLVGIFSDRIHSRWGRRHPLMLLSAAPLGLFFYLLFQPPMDLSESQLFFWFALSWAGMGLAKSFYMVPHTALGAELTDNYDERTSVFGFNWMVHYVGMALLGWFVYNLIFPTTEGFDNGLLNAERYQLLGIWGGLFVFSVVLFCTFSTLNQIPYLHRVGNRSSENMFESISDTIHELWILLHNRSYFAIIACWLIMSISGGVLAFSLTYSLLYGFEFTTEQIAYREYLRLPGALLVIFSSVWVVQKLDKRYTLITVTSFTVLLLGLPFCLRLLGLPPANGTTALLILFYGCWTIAYFSYPIVSIVIDSMLGDIADEHELITGNRSEGLIYSFRTFVYKATRGLGGFLGGIALTMINFPDNATVETIEPEVVTGLAWLSGPLYIFFVGSGLLFAFLYKINRQRHTEILQKLQLRKQG